MKVIFPFSSADSIQQTWHSYEFRRLIIIDFLLDSFSSGQSVTMYTGNFETYEGIEDLKELMSIQPQSSSFLEKGFYSHVRSINRDVKDLLHAIKNMDKSLFGKQKFWELASLFHANNTPNSTNVLNESLDSKDFEFTVDQYKLCKKNIAQGTQLYTDSLKYQLNKSEIIPSSFIKEEEDESLVAQKYLQSFKERALKIQKRLYTFISTYSDLRQASFTKVADQLKDQLDLWMEIEDNFGFNPKEDFVNKLVHLTEELHSIAKVKFAKISTLNPKAFLEQLTRLEQVNKENVRKECLMLNSRNAGDDDIMNLEIDLAQLVKDINDCQLFSKEVNINSLSLSLKLDAVNKLIKTLDNGIYELRSDGELSTWLSFYNRMDLTSQHLIDALLSEGTETWQGIYDTWFLEEMLKANGLETHREMYDKLNQVQENWESIRFDFVDIARTLLAEKGTNFNILPLEAIVNHEEGDVLVLGRLSEEQWDKLCVKTDRVLGLKPKENKHFSSDDTIHESLLNLYGNEDDLEAKLLKSKLLATFLLEDSEQLDLLLAPDGNVIIDSRYSDIGDLVKDNLSNYKQVKMRENGFKVLTEFFLNEAGNNYYYYDQTALEFETPKDIYQHLSKIKTLQLAGYYTIAINRSQLHNPSYISHLMEIDKTQNA